MFILPINKDNKVRRIPWVLVAIIIANTLALLATYLLYSPEAMFQRYGFTPAQHSWITLLTSMFLHSGFWHIAGNMWFLWMFGNRVENTFGKWLFLPVYLICGLGGAELHWLLNQHSSIPCVGASGAISGIAGTYLVLFPKSKFDLVIYFRWTELKTIHTRATAAVGAWFGEQFLLGLLTQALAGGGIAYWAHVGGFATGTLIGGVFVLVVPKKARLARERAKPWYMQDAFNKDDGYLTVVKLSGPDPRQALAAKEHGEPHNMEPK